MTTNITMSTLGTSPQPMTTNITMSTLGTSPQPPQPPPPSLTDILEQFPDYRASLTLGVYGCGVQVAVGTVANLLTLAVMTRRSLLASSTCFYFSALAVADLLVLYLACLRRLLFVVNDQHDIYTDAQWSCCLMNFLTYFSYDLSSWILTAMTVDRFIAIRYPLRAATACTVGKACVVLALLVLLCTAKNVHFLFTFTLTELNGCLPRDQHVEFIDAVWPWLDASFHSFLPFFLLSLFNILIIHYHSSALRCQKALRAQVTTRGQGAKFSQRLTVMLLVVSLFFMILTAPKVILFIIRKKVFVFFPPEGGIDFAVVARYSLVSAVFNFLLWTNHTINFFLYCLSGKRFRREFLRMLSRCVHRKRHAQVFVTGLPAAKASRKWARRLRQPTSPRRGSNISVVSEDINGATLAQQAVQPPAETEDPRIRTQKWAMVTFDTNS